MLKELYIKNLGLIKENKVVFSDNLNVITGESGAGKSLILKSLSLLFSDRVSKDHIGNFDDDVVIKAIFEPSQLLISYLKEQCVSINEDDYLILERIISKNKKNTSRLNHEIVTQDFFKKISPYLISFSLQNETSLFQDSQYILNILDSKHNNVLLDYQQVYHTYLEISEEINKLKKDKKEQEEKLSFYEYQQKELEDFNLEEEDFDLDNIIKRLKNQHNIEKIVSNIEENLSSSYSNLKETYSLMQMLNNYDESYIDSEKFADFFYQIEDFIDSILKYQRNLGNDTDLNINDLQSRSFKLKDFQKKYGLTYNEIKQYQYDLETKINTITNFDDILKVKEDDCKKIYTEQLKPLADNLTELRKEYASYICVEIQKHLSEMNMENSKIIFNINKNDKLNRYGQDQVDILLQHLEQEPKYLLKAASGGELSRIILALKIIGSEQNDSPLMIFDEIDSGTSGKTANAIGKKLKLLSKQKQIICITHTPQVAVYSDNHILITKYVDGNNYISNSKVLTDEQNVLLEIARMISGHTINDITMENAKQLRNGALNNF